MQSSISTHAAAVSGIRGSVRKAGIQGRMSDALVNTVAGKGEAVRG